MQKNAFAALGIVMQDQQIQLHGKNLTVGDQE